MISYAHEDKDFAWALADNLKQDHDVWIDRDEMKVGDSIFQQVSQGLRDADFGVVIFSPHYVKKTWTQREVAGFTTLEDETRKIVLPVWKDIDKAGVAAFAAFMADRTASLASRGVDTVASELRYAIAIASNAVTVATKPSAAQKLAALGQDFKAKAEAEALLRTMEGAKQVGADYEKICAQLKVHLEAAQSDSLKFNVRRGSDGTFVAYTRSMLVLRLYLENLYLNSASDAILHIEVLRRERPREFGEEGGPPSELDSSSYQPWFAGQTVVWRMDGRKAIDTDAVINVAIEMLHRQLERESD